MKLKWFHKNILLRAIVFIFPISILIYDFTASKLNTYGETGFATPMVVFLFLLASIISYKNRKFLHFREIKYVVLFFLLSMPAYMMSTFISVESFVRYFALIAFVPLGFMSGISWAYRFNLLESRNKDRLLTVFMMPAIIAAAVIASSTIFVLFEDEEDSRDYVFGIVLFLPLLLYYKKNIWSIIMLTIASYICIISTKRTGMLCVGSIMAFLFLIKVGVKKVTFSRIVKLLIVAFLVVFIANKYLPDLQSQWEASIERFDEMDDDSNEARVVKYGRVLNNLQSANIFTLFFGNGCYASVQSFGSPVHNDWLEIAFDYGILPLFCVIVLFYSLLVRGFKAVRKDFSSSMALLATLLVFLITTMGNCMFTNYADVFVLMFTLGFALANMRIQCKNKSILACVYNK